MVVQRHGAKAQRWPQPRPRPGGRARPALARSPGELPPSATAIRRNGALHGGGHIHVHAQQRKQALTRAPDSPAPSSSLAAPGSGVGRGSSSPLNHAGLQAGYQRRVDQEDGTSGPAAAGAEGVNLTDLDPQIRL